MNAAFSVWENRIAPVFDVTPELVIVTQQAERFIMKRLPIQDNSPSTLVETLLGKHVSVLVCGAISRPLQNAITTRNIVIFPFISGQLDTVVNAWRTGDLENDRFRMPGCGHRHGRCHGNQETTPGQRGAGHMNRHGRKRNDHPITFMAHARYSGSLPDTATANEPVCRCPRCGLVMPHVPGEPCAQRRCPNCHAPMVRA
ncbi:hypothetical protein GO013_02690 [Pseudodesulfovibrio sp. JC047]|nr:hypothetical protein [Pseudodesulfovibrio sp. JC047]